MILDQLSNGSLSRHLHGCTMHASYGYRIAENIGGGKFWRIWRIGRESSKFSCPKFSSKSFPSEN